MIGGRWSCLGCHNSLGICLRYPGFLYCKSVSMGRKFMKTAKRVGFVLLAYLITGYMLMFALGCSTNPVRPVVGPCCEDDNDCAEHQPGYRFGDRLK